MALGQMIIRLRGLARSCEATTAVGSAVDADLCPELLSMLAHTTEAIAVRRSELIPDVLVPRGDPEIGAAVVQRVAVAMIDLLPFARRCDHSVHQECAAFSIICDGTGRDVSGASRRAAICKGKPLVTRERGIVRVIDDSDQGARESDGAAHAAASRTGVSLAAGASVTRSGNEDRTSISSSVALAMGPSLSPVARNSRIAISRDMSRLPLRIWLA